MRRIHIGIIVAILCIITGGTTLCVARWNVWFVTPEPPAYTGDTIPCYFNTFGREHVPGFVQHQGIWQDTIDEAHLRFIVFGDVHNQVDSAQWETVGARHGQIDFYAQCGDFMERSQFYYSQLLSHSLQNSPFANLPLIACIGNHEYIKGIIKHPTPLWLELFPCPANGPKRFLGTTYYVDFEYARYIVIDTNPLLRLSDYTILNTWLHKVISEAQERYTIVMMHHPVYSCSMGRSNVGISCFLKHTLGKADLVVSGHDHNYARRLPFVGISSARKFYLHKLHADMTRVGSGFQHYLLVDITADTLHMRTYEMNEGFLYDEIKLIHHADSLRIEDLGVNRNEYIDIPNKYKERNGYKVKKFNKRKEERLAMKTPCSQE